jgi:hypothetical protein
MWQSYQVPSVPVVLVGDVADVLLDGLQFGEQLAQLPGLHLNLGFKSKNRPTAGYFPTTVVFGASVVKIYHTRIVECVFLKFFLYNYKNTASGI